VEQAEALPALLARPEEQLHADADSGHGPAGGGALPERVVESVAGEASGATKA